MKDKKESNIYELFEKRTGKKYENWIQAWLITLKQKRNENMNWKTRIRLWWWDYVHFPLWHRFGSKESKQEIKEALRKRREEGGCSMWRKYLKDHPEVAKYEWEKEYVKEKEND